MPVFLVTRIVLCYGDPVELYYTQVHLLYFILYILYYTLYFFGLLVFDSYFINKFHYTLFL